MVDIHVCDGHFPSMCHKGDNHPNNFLFNMQTFTFCTKLQKHGPKNMKLLEWEQVHWKCSIQMMVNTICWKVRESVIVPREIL